jgi:hypothetical protein
LRLRLSSKIAAAPHCCFPCSLLFCASIRIEAPMTRETLPYDCGKFIVDLPATQTARRSPIRYLDLRGLGLRHSPCSVPQDSTQRTTSSCGTPGAPDRASASAALMCACCQCFNAPAAAAPSSPWVSQRSCPSQPQLNSTLHISSLSHAQIGAGMAEKDRFTLQDDLPKEDPWKDDLLGFAPFAERLSKVIGSIDAPNGYVIGLHGEWGSGKTTALNFVRAFLRKNNQEVESGERRIDIIEFRPWIVLGTRTSLLHF